MKILNYITIILFTCFFIACEDTLDKRVPEPKGPWNMGPITEYTVTPINGGAEITYAIPNSPDIMYVMAEYERNGKVFTEKASIHSNKLTIEGFHRVNNVKASIYLVNRYEQRSAPLTIEFEPLESLIDIALNSLKLQPSFGGLVGEWDNPKATELGVRLLTYDDSLYKAMVTHEMYYTQIVEEKHSFRGHPAVENTFGISFEDKWGNVSDTVLLTTTPFFETQIAKPYADVRSLIPHDNTSNLKNRTTASLWDGIVNTSSNGWLTASGNKGLSITFDMKQVVKLSRILHHAYHVNSVYGQANITEMEVWAIDKLDYDKFADTDYWLDSLSVREGRLNVNPMYQLPARTFKDDWHYLGYFKVPYYPALADMRALSASGSEYEIPIDVPPVRYIRIYVRAIAMAIPPPATNYFSMGEITFFGDNTVPQN